LQEQQHQSFSMVYAHLQDAFVFAGGEYATELCV
jgi:hypothetical protein